MDEKEYDDIDSFAAPKPKKDGSGSTAQFLYSKKAKCVFLTLAKQKPNTSIVDARFDYENKILLKLNASELGWFIMVFSGKKDSINDDKGLFHKFGETKSSINCNKNDVKYGGGFYLKASKDSSNCAVKIEDQEAQVLISLFNQAIVNIYGWDLF